MICKVTRNSNNNLGPVLITYHGNNNPAAHMWRGLRLLIFAGSHSEGVTLTPSDSAPHAATWRVGHVANMSRDLFATYHGTIAIQNED